MTLPVPQYLVAFNNGPLDDPVNITTVASPPGTLGAANVWTDITPWVQSHHIARGRQHELSQFEAGTCELSLLNRDGRFSPFNTSSPYNGLLVPRRPVQVRVTWNGVTYARFTGHADSWAVQWPDASSSYVTLHATDAFRMFNQATISAYPTQVLTDSPVGYWRLGDVAGSTTAASALSSSSVGTVATGAGAGTAVFGQTGAMGSDPTTSVQLGSSGSLSGEIDFPSPLSSVSAGMTLEAWLKGSDPAAIWNLEAQVGATSQYKLNVVPAGVGAGTLGYAHNIFDGNWHHLAVTLDGVGNILLYLDGVQVASNSGWTPINTNALTNVDAYLVNTQDVAIYGSALSAARIAAHYSSGGFVQESTAARIGRVLSGLGLSSTARVLDSNTTTVQAVTSSLTSTSSLSHMQAVEATESGALFMGTEGRVQFRSRQTLFSGAVYTTSQATIGDGGADMPFEAGPSVPIDDIDLYNQANATRQGGITQRATNNASASAYGPVTWQPSGSLIGISDSEVLGLCQYAVNRYATPVTRVEQVTVNLADAVTVGTIASILALDLLYRVTVERTLPPGGGSGFSQAANVEHIEEVSTSTGYTISFQLAKADPAWWVLGTATLGQTTTLAF